MHHRVCMEHIIGQDSRTEYAPPSTSYNPTSWFSPYMFLSRTSSSLKCEWMQGVNVISFVTIWSLVIYKMGATTPGGQTINLYFSCRINVCFWSYNCFWKHQLVSYLILSNSEKQYYHKYSTWIYQAFGNSDIRRALVKSLGEEDKPVQEAQSASSR